VVSVRIEDEGDNAIVSVTDNGRGIAHEHLPNIFRPFYTTKGNGTGLGLSLARRIVEAHHGRIEVSSAVNNGTTFAVLLPIRQAAAAEA
jgi:signal transduction histidine kinase